MAAKSSQFRNYIQLTKPTIILLVVITGLCTMAAEGSIFHEPLKMFLVLVATAISAASANALNQYIDRDIDAEMNRTKSRRPLPLNQLNPTAALVFALSLGVISNLYLWIKINPLSSIISVATILFYVFVYTLWLKRRHYYNIVIGGAAGATAPLIASAAAYGSITPLAWTLFVIIFMWTPPHFWALALALKDEYEKVKIPMLPNVLGDRRTIIEIWIYTILLLPITILPYAIGAADLFYLASAVLCWLWYFRESWIQLRAQTKKAYKRLFFISIAYLFLLFLALGIDGVIRYAKS